MQRVAIVTGGSTGIGRALSTGLAADGLAVVVGYHGNEVGARDTLRAIEDAIRELTATCQQLLREPRVKGGPCDKSPR